ncbi:prephenate dehydrogenase [Aquimarina sp. AD10]|uniref:Prephenate dehydrogenase n=1 Tax=Aquimarina aggregata TaxID=1642818 RepID=A0A162CLL2_9FLAO|nr:MULTISPECIES: prephenate dehydrogenase [Aquimarina]AXT60983.1 prephenate dehydrogenase [Aquimarina sp. AD10]KZS39084.1 prephenate dehydrogenase [Aquimarina aggregata]RKM96281.1 prephenate dehydrogenase [Aquimarina sp. AD10]
MNVFIIGIGLIGGSFAIDIKAAFDDAKIYGIDESEENLNKALDLGLIQYKSSLDKLEKADIVIVAIPVDATVQMLPVILDKINDDCLVFDVGSTKQKLCKTVSEHKKRRNYLAAHPIAGTEFSGPQAAIANLYRGKTNIICEVEKTAFKLQERGMEIFSRLGMRIRYMDSASHDKHIAYVSHLSHISSFMLGKTVIEKEKNERDIFDMAGSGFASTVRLAKSSPAMWAPIFKHNKENVIETLEEYIANLTQFKKLIEDDNFTEIYKEMQDTNHIKTILKGIS